MFLHLCGRHCNGNNDENADVLVKIYNRNRSPEEGRSGSRSSETLRSHKWRPAQRIGTISTILTKNGTIVKMMNMSDFSRKTGPITRPTAMIAHESRRLSPIVTEAVHIAEPTPRRVTTPEKKTPATSAAPIITVVPGRPTTTMHAPIDIMSNTPPTAFKSGRYLAPSFAKKCVTIVLILYIASTTAV